MAAVVDFVSQSPEHRIALCRRFGQRIGNGDAYFMSPIQGAAGSPHTVTDGVARPLNGLNRLVLMQVMHDKGWLDSRFFTSEQVRKAGWALRAGAKPVSLEFLVGLDVQGLVSQDPVVKRFHVFNANDIDGVQRQAPSTPCLASDVTQALSRAGIAVDAAGVGPAVEAWALSLLRASGAVQGDSVVLAVAPGALRSRLACSLVLAEIGLSCEMADSSHFALAWASQLERDPLVFCDAVNAAQSLAREMVLQVRAAALERLTASELASVRMRGSLASPRVQALFDDKNSVVLDVPFAEKDVAKELGALWYGPESVWFMPSGLDIEKFARWVPQKKAAVSLSVEATREVLLASFAREMHAMGLEAPQELLDDGIWHNVSVTTKPEKNKSGSYILSLTGGRYGQPIGTIMNKHTGQSFTWTHVGASLTPEQRAKARAVAQAREEEASARALQVQDAAAGHACEIWDVALPAAGHGYVAKKGIAAENLRQVSGSVLLSYPEFVGESGRSAIRSDESYLLVPMSDEAGRLRALQVISPDGQLKSFMRGAQKKGTMMVIGGASFESLAREVAGRAVAFGEGLATMASFHEAAGIPAVVCFDAGNLESVASSLIPQLPFDCTPVVAVDNDQFYLERALGFAAEKVGLNPFALSAQTVRRVLCDGVSALREVSLGDLVTDGQWHQAPGGKFKAECLFSGEAVKSIDVQVVCADGSATSMSVSNRGLDAGQVVLERCREANRALTVACPAFQSLWDRPTDWNDLVQREGLAAARAVLGAVLPAGLLKYKAPPVQALQATPVLRSVGTENTR